LTLGKGGRFFGKSFMPPRGTRMDENWSLQTMLYGGDCRVAGRQPMVLRARWQVWPGCRSVPEIVASDALSESTQSRL
jgi:hypothetical protein